MSTLKVDSILDTSGNATVAGTVLQTVYHSWNDVTSTTSTRSYVAVSNGSKSITSIGANSKFLVTVTGNVYQNAGNGTNLGISRTIGGTTNRILGEDGTYGDTWMGFGNGNGTGTSTLHREYLDSPSQSAGTTITYNTLLGYWTVGTVYLNYSSYTITSMMVIQEIAA